MDQYYKEDLRRLINFTIPYGKSSIECYLKGHRLYTNKTGRFDYVILNNVIGDLADIQLSFEQLKKFLHEDSRLVITYYNHLWEPILKLASLLGWRKVTYEQNWVNTEDLQNLLELAGYEVVSSQKRLLIPVKIPVISNLCNKWLAPLPIINALCLTICTVAKQRPLARKQYTVSIIIPARNEAGNIPNIGKQIPQFGPSQEIIFIEGHSKDNTWEVIQNEVKKHPSKTGPLTYLAFRQRGKGKADAVRLGFQKATGQLLMILDADLSVEPKELVKFYQVFEQGLGDFANGSRMIYPMEKEAMRTLNKIGNRLFSFLFTWILGQRFRDTLCGTKVMLKKDYQQIVKNRKVFGDFDPFGDFDLLFGAVKQNLKIVEVPVKYKERVYGSTNINRFRHGMLLFKMTWFAFRKFRAW